MWLGMCCRNVANPLFTCFTRFLSLAFLRATATGGGCPFLPCFFSLEGSYGGNTVVEFVALLLALVFGTINVDWLPMILFSLSCNVRSNINCSWSLPFICTLLQNTVTPIVAIVFVSTSAFRWHKSTWNVRTCELSSKFRDFVPSWKNKFLSWNLTLYAIFFWSD